MRISDWSSDVCSSDLSSNRKKQSPLFQIHPQAFGIIEMMHLPAEFARRPDVGGIVIDEQHRVRRMAEPARRKFEDTGIWLDAFLVPRHHDVAQKVEQRFARTDFAPEGTSEIGNGKPIGRAPCRARGSQ